MERVYVMPISGSGSKQQPRRPRYASTDLAGTPWTMMDYGIHAQCLITADVTPAQHSALISHNDVTAFPEDLDTLLGSQAAELQIFLRKVDIPADWITATLTYRELIDGLSCQFQYMQRVNFYRATPLFSRTVALELPWQDLPADARVDMQEAADSFPVSMAQISPTTLLETALTSMASQLPGWPLPLAVGASEWPS